MIIALVTALFLGGGGGSIEYLPFPSNFENQVKEVIVDDDRKDTVLNLYEDMQKYMKVHTKKIDEFSKSLWDALDDPNTRDIDYLEWKDKVLNERKILEDKLLYARRELVKNIEEEEWNKIFAPSGEDN